MHPVGKALWFIETRLADDISLAEIACFAGVSRYHLLRAFGVATGQSVMRHVRGRRLTEAARHLAAGAPDILTVALDAGYGSHEAFTRAFRDQFGLTPEAVRAQRHLDNITLVEPIRMDESLIIELEPPRFENGRALAHRRPRRTLYVRDKPGHPAAMGALPAVHRQHSWTGRSHRVRRVLQCRRRRQFRLHRWRRGSQLRRHAPRVQPRADRRTTLCRLLASRPHLADKRHRLYDLEQVAARVGPTRTPTRRTSNCTMNGSIRALATGRSRSGCR